MAGKKMTLQRRIERAEKRILSQREVDANGCWNFTGSYFNHGYGRTHTPFKTHQDGLVHRIFWEITFKKRLPTEVYLCHKCDNKRCFNPDHLYEGDIFTNRQDAKERGLTPKPKPKRGETNPMSRLKEDDVIEMRKLRKSGWTCAKIAKKFKVSDSHAHAVVTARVWKHLKDGLE